MLQCVDCPEKKRRLVYSAWLWPCNVQWNIRKSQLYFPVNYTVDDGNNCKLSLLGIDMVKVVLCRGEVDGFRMSKLKQMCLSGVARGLGQTVEHAMPSAFITTHFWC